jgi:nitrogen fixation protein NifZ
MSKFQMGDMVFAAQDLYNEALEETGESAIPGLAPEALIATAGTRGVIVNVGTRGVIVNVGHAKEMPDEEIYLVRFEMDAAGALGEPVGCLTDELSESGL